MTSARVARWFAPGIYLFVSILVLGGSFFEPACVTAAPSQGTPPPTVTVALVEEQEVNPPMEYVGRMEAIQAVDLRARVEGFLEQVGFQEGADVRAGDLLFVIEQAPYRAKINEARAKVKEAEAALTKARQYLQRLQAVKSGGVSATDIEAATSSELQAAARQLEAKAALEMAELDLSYTTIRAPISGRIGRSAYSRGNLVGPSSAPLARIVQLHPIRAVYSVSENEPLDPSGAKGVRNSGKQQVVLRLKLADGAFFPHPGRIDFIDNQVDPGTGTIAVRAVFDNPQGVLLPGQFVTVTVSQRQAARKPVIPQAAVMEDREGRFVFVVDDQKTAQRRRLLTGVAVQNGWIVESGLKAGETIIVQGVQKVRPGQTVSPQTIGNISKE